MARLKNALRAHFIAPFVKDGEIPKESDYMPLAKWISSVSDDTDEQTDDTGYYDGDGTPETTVVGVSGSYGFEGTYDPEDPAQSYVAGLKWKIGDDRKVFHKIVSSDGKKQWVGVATVSDIVAGAGDATEFEEFGCTITYNVLPEETKAEVKQVSKATTKA